MIFKTLITAGAAALAFGGPVAAQDWTGGYAGASLGSGEVCALGSCEDATGWSIFGGYLTENNGMVFGGEAEFSSQDVDTATDNLDSVRLKGRVGVNAGNVMPYAVLGVSHVDFGSNGEDNGTLFGLGVEVMAGGNARVGVEFLHEEADNIGGVSGESDTISIRGAFGF